MVQLWISTLPYLTVLTHSIYIIPGIHQAVGVSRRVMIECRCVYYKYIVAYIVISVVSVIGGYLTSLCLLTALTSLPAPCDTM